VLPAAEGILTTDLYPKVSSATIGSGGRIVGIAKGAVSRTIIAGSGLHSSKSANTNHACRA